MTGGAVVDVLAVAVGGGGALTVLAGSLSVWLRRPRGADVRISVERPDGTRVEITGDRVCSPAELEEILRTGLGD